jgi:hypothetical protein
MRIAARSALGNRFAGAALNGAVCGLGWFPFMGTF